MCIGSNSVNQAQDLISVTKFEDFPNSLLPNLHSTSGHIYIASNPIHCCKFSDLKLKTFL